MGSSSQTLAALIEKERCVLAPFLALQKEAPQWPSEPGAGPFGSSRSSDLGGHVAVVRGIVYSEGLLAGLRSLV